jgi:hypothetical protein
MIRIGVDAALALLIVLAALIAAGMVWAVLA